MTKILIVEDEDDFAFILKDVLKKAGYEPVWARDGQQGLDQLAKLKPDLVLLDWSMPVMDGESFCRELRRRPESRETPVILLTVKQGEPNELEALHFGADDFLNKPFQPDELLARVRAVLRRTAKA